MAAFLRAQRSRLRPSDVGLLPDPEPGGGARQACVVKKSPNWRGDMVVALLDARLGAVSDGRRPWAGDAGLPQELGSGRIMSSAKRSAVRSAVVGGCAWNWRCAHSSRDE